METLLDIQIDAYVKVDMDNFVQLVDAVGGVKVTNPTWLVDPHLGLSLAPGTHRLDGATALDYMRTRVHQQRLRPGGSAAAGAAGARAQVR